MILSPLPPPGGRAFWAGPRADTKEKRGGAGDNRQRPPPTRRRETDENQGFCHLRGWKTGRCEAV